MRCRAALARRPSSGQHEVPGAVRRQILGDLQSDRTQSAGHQICSITAQFELRRGLLVLRAGPAEQGRPRDPGAAIWSSLAGSARMWRSIPDHSSASPADRSASPPHSSGCSKDAVRPNPHRQDCTGETVSVTRNPLCAAGDHPDGRHRSRPRAAARKSRCVPPRTRCCIRSSDRVDVAPSGSRPPRCTMRSTGSSAAAARSAASSCSSSASDSGSPTIRCGARVRSAASASGATVSASSAMRSQPSLLDRFECRQPERPTSPSGSRSGRRRWSVSCAVDCVGRQAVSATPTVWSSPSAAPTSAASSSIRPSSRSRTVSVRTASVGVPTVLARRVPDTGDAGTGRWADRPCGPCTGATAAKSGRWPAT